MDLAFVLIIERCVWGNIERGVEKCVRVNYKEI
jgi:hypothetical protein